MKARESSEVVRDEFPELMRVSEAARALCVVPSTVYRYLEQGALASVRFQGSVRVKRESVRAMLAMGDK